MKRVHKKKYMQAAAREHLAEKYGMAIGRVKAAGEGRNHWLFRLSSEESAPECYEDVLEIVMSAFPGLTAEQAQQIALKEHEGAEDSRRMEASGTFKEVLATIEARRPGLAKQRALHLAGEVYKAIKKQRPPRKPQTYKEILEAIKTARPGLAEKRAKHLARVEFQAVKAAKELKKAEAK